MKTDKKMGSNVCMMCGTANCNCGKFMAVLGLGAAVLGVLLLGKWYPWFDLTNVVGIVLVVKGLKKAYFGFRGC